MFWENFVSLCAERGISPNAVAAELSLSSGSVTAWKGGTVPRETTLKKIANYFGVSVDYLIGFEQKENPTVFGEALDPVTKELFSIVDSATDAERKMMLEMIRVIKRVRNEETE